MAGSAGGASDLAAVWRRVFEEHASGGGTIVAVCARQGVSRGSWYFWKRKLGIASPAAKPRAKFGSGFAELVVREGAPPAAAFAIEIVLRSGAVVRVGAGAGERELAMVLRVLASC